MWTNESYSPQESPSGTIWILISNQTSTFSSFSDQLRHARSLGIVNTLTSTGRALNQPTTGSMVELHCLGSGMMSTDCATLSTQPTWPYHYMPSRSSVSIQSGQFLSSPTLPILFSLLLAIWSFGKLARSMSAKMQLELPYSYSWFRKSKQSTL